MQLRPDQYELLREYQLYDIYVNELGDVCISECDQLSSRPYCTVFATTFWSPGTLFDNEGFPLFQGKRGVCAKIRLTMADTSTTSRSEKTDLFTMAARTLKSYFLKPRLLQTVMIERQKLYDQMVTVKHQLKIYKHIELLTVSINNSSQTITTFSARVRNGNLDETTKQVYLNNIKEAEESRAASMIRRQDLLTKVMYGSKLAAQEELRRLTSKCAELTEEIFSTHTALGSAIQS